METFVYTTWEKLDPMLKKETAKRLLKCWKNELYECHEVATVQQCVRHMNEYWRSIDVIHRNVFFVVHRNDEFVGCVGVDYYAKTGGTYIVYLFVDEKYRKNGIGTELIELAIKHVASGGCSIVGLWCEDDLVQFYRNRGFWWSGFGKNVMYRNIDVA